MLFFYSILFINIYFNQVEMKESSKGLSQGGWIILYYICYIILAMYMLYSDQELSYNLSKNLLLLPRILKLIEDVVDDSTPLFRDHGGQCKYTFYVLRNWIFVYTKYYIIYVFHLSVHPTIITHLQALTYIQYVLFYSLLICILYICKHNSWEIMIFIFYLKK